MGIIYTHYRHSCKLDAGTSTYSISTCNENKQKRNFLVTSDTFRPGHLNNRLLRWRKAFLRNFPNILGCSPNKCDILPNIYLFPPHTVGKYWVWTFVKLLNIVYMKLRIQFCPEPSLYPTKKNTLLIIEIRDTL